MGEGKLLDNRNESMSESEWTMMASDWTIGMNSDGGIGMYSMSALECWTIGRHSKNVGIGMNSDVGIGMYSMSALECWTIGMHSKNVGIGMNSDVGIRMYSMSASECTQCRH